VRRRGARGAISRHGLPAGNARIDAVHKTASTRAVDAVFFV